MVQRLRLQLARRAEPGTKTGALMRQVAIDILDAVLCTVGDLLEAQDPATTEQPNQHNVQATRIALAKLLLDSAAVLDTRLLREAAANQRIATLAQMPSECLPQAGAVTSCA